MNYLITELRSTKFVGLIISLVVAFDQAVKWLVMRSGGFWVLNKGVAFSIGAGQEWLGWVVGLILLFVILNLFQDLRRQSGDFKSSLVRGFLRIGENKSKWIAWALLIGGGISNLIDRVLRGGVVDYIKIWQLPVFNLADIAINVAIVLLLAELVKNKSINEKRE